MENDKLTKVKLKGNESFNIREGWLRKGLRAIEQYPDLFTRTDAMQILGVGSKMVKAIKYWLLATGLVTESIVKGKHHLVPTRLGEIIKSHDTYFEDTFTLYILHHNIISNKELAIVWNLFFNKFNADAFTREDVFTAIEAELRKATARDIVFSQSLLKDDCNSLLRMYTTSESESDPEENLSSPFATLGLLARNSSDKNQYIKTMPKFEKIDTLLILYIMQKNLKESQDGVNIGELLNGENNVGKTLNLTRPILNEYLDQLRLKGYISVNRTAGLDMIYFAKNITAENILIKYYTQGN